MEKNIYTRCNSLLNTAITIVAFFLLLGAILLVGYGGILNDLDKEVVKIEELEKNKLLDNPPDYVSDFTKLQIELSKNSTGLKLYIKETEASGQTLYKAWLSLIVLFLFMIFVKILFYFYKRKNNFSQFFVYL